MAKGKKREGQVVTDLPSIQEHLDNFTDAVTEVSDALADKRGAEELTPQTGELSLDTGVIEEEKESPTAGQPHHSWWKPPRAL